MIRLCMTGRRSLSRGCTTLQGWSSCGSAPLPMFAVVSLCILDIVNALSPRSDLKFNFVISTREDPLKVDLNRRKYSW